MAHGANSPLLAFLARIATGTSGAGGRATDAARTSIVFLAVHETAAGLAAINGAIAAVFGAFDLAAPRPTANTSLARPHGTGNVAVAAATGYFIRTGLICRVAGDRAVFSLGAIDFPLAVIGFVTAHVTIPALRTEAAIRAVECAAAAKTLIDAFGGTSRGLIGCGFFIRKVIAREQIMGFITCRSLIPRDAIARSRAIGAGAIVAKAAEGKVRPAALAQHQQGGQQRKRMRIHREYPFAQGRSSPLNNTF
jgi:hypothetical protein